MKESRLPPSRTGARTLLPEGKAQERQADIGEIDILITSIDPARTDPFRGKCFQFRESFREGDTLVEFCSSKSDWRAGMGLGGYSIRRDGVEIARLILGMS